jgi:hypothetical protein
MMEPATIALMRILAHESQAALRALRVALHNPIAGATVCSGA